MKTFLKVLTIVFCSVTAIFALAFSVIEGRLLFAGDWLIYDNALNGFIRYALRFLLSLAVLFAVITDVVNCKINNQNLSVILWFLYVGAVLSSVVICIFASNYVGLVCLALSIVLALLKSGLLFFIQRDKK